MQLWQRHYMGSFLTWEVRKCSFSAQSHLYGGPHARVTRPIEYKFLQCWPLPESSPDTFMETLLSSPFSSLHTKYREAWRQAGWAAPGPWMILQRNWTLFLSPIRKVGVIQRSEIFGERKSVFPSTPMRRPSQNVPHGNRPHSISWTNSLGAGRTSKAGLSGSL